MLISNSGARPSARPAVASALARTEGAAQAAPAEVFDRPSEALITLYRRNDEARSTGIKVAKSVLGGVLVGGLGAYAGLGTGAGAGLAGAAVMALPGALVGAIGVGVIAEKMGTSGSDTAGAALAGGVVGALGALAGGAYLGSQVVSTAAAIGMGLAGAAAGAYYAFS